MTSNQTDEFVEFRIKSERTLLSNIGQKTLELKYEQSDGFTTGILKFMNDKAKVIAKTSHPLLTSTSELVSVHIINDESDEFNQRFSIFTISNDGYIWFYVSFTDDSGIFKMCKQTHKASIASSLTCSTLVSLENGNNYLYIGTSEGMLLKYYIGAESDYSCW